VDFRPWEVNIWYGLNVHFHRLPYIHWFVKPEISGQGGHENHTDGNEFKVCQREPLVTTGSDLKNEPAKLYSGDGVRGMESAS